MTKQEEVIYVKQSTLDYFKDMIKDYDFHTGYDYDPVVDPIDDSVQTKIK